MDTQDSSNQGPKEITVTCKQCGSTSMERLDRREYKCTHCGAITVVSDDDADQLEDVLGKFFNSSGASGQTRVWTTNSPGVSTKVRVSSSEWKAPPAMVAGQRVGTAAKAHPGRALFALGWLIALVVLYSYALSSTSPKQAASAVTVPPDSLKLIDRQGIAGVQVATLNNTSKQTVDLRNLVMTSYNGDFKKDSTPGTVGVDHLQPNESATITFPSPADATRFEFSAPDLTATTDTLVRMKLTQQKLLHAVGTNDYQLVGVVQNPLKHSLAEGKIGVTLYDPDHRIIGWGNGTIKALDPGEKAAISVDIDMEESRGQIASYGYIIDISPA